MDSLNGSRRALSRAGLWVVMLSSVLSGCCVMTPLASVCAPGGYGGGGGSGGYRHHNYHGAAQPDAHLSGAGAVASVEARTLSSMYAYASTAPDAQ